MATVDVFTGELRTRYLDAYTAVDPAKPAPFEKFVEILDSQSRIESHVWMSPSPGIQRYMGHRRFGKIDRVLYDVTNYEYDAGFQVPLRDIEDDKTSGYMKRAEQLARKAKLYPGRAALKHMAAGKTNKGFDGSAFFADSHTIGTGDNKIAGTAAAADAVVHNMVVMVVGGETFSGVKPLVWQDRKPFLPDDNGGTKEAALAKKVSFWVDGEGAAAFGFWWDALLVEYANTPTVAEVQTDLGNVEKQLRGFKLPTALSGDESEYVHEQVEFNQQNIVIASSATVLANVLKQALGQDWSPQTVGGTTLATTNQYQGWGTLVVSAHLNTIT